MVEHYFRTESYTVTQKRFQKKFKEEPYLSTIQRIVERFQKAYMLNEESRSGRPHALSEADRTNLKKHVEESRGTSPRRVAQELGMKLEAVRLRLKKEEFYSYCISVLHELKPTEADGCLPFNRWWLVPTPTII